MTPRTVSGTWQPHSVRPTKPTCALIAVALERDGSEPFMCQTLYEFDLKRGLWIDLVSEEPLDRDVFMWLDHDELVPDDLMSQVTP